MPRKSNNLNSQAKKLELKKYWCIKGHFNFDQAVLVDQLCTIVQPGYALEIGFATGRSAAALLTSCSTLQKMISVDINLDYMAPHGRFFAKQLSEAFEFFRVIEGSSHVILNDKFFGNEFPIGLDWVTVDGGHDYKTALHDIKIAAKYLKTNGVIIIDDYMSGPPNGCEIPSVTKAVDDFCVSEHSVYKIRWYKKGKGIAIITKSKSIFDQITQVLSTN